MSDKSELDILAGLIVNSLNEVGRARQLYAAGMNKSGNTKHHHMWCEFGYPEHLTFDHYYNMYERNGAAFGAVHKLLDTCWIDNPVIIDGEKADKAKKTTKWEKAVTKFMKNKWAHIRDTDRRNMVGHYSALIMQFRDNREWSEPVDRALVNRLGEKGLVKLIPAWEAQIKPGELVQDQRSDRYGQPEYYWFNEQPVGDVTSSTMGPRRQVQIHPERVIIFCEGSEDESTMSGIPLLRAGYNDIQDMAKASGGSAEGFYKNAARQLGINMSKDTDMQTIIAEAKKKGYTGLADAMNAAIDKLNRSIDSALVTQDGDVKVLSVAAADPKPTWEVSANQFASSVQMPFTMLFGQQTGRLASDEDKTDMARRGNGRRNGFLSDRIGVFIETMWTYGVIDQPRTGEVTIEWSDLLAPSQKEKIANAKELATVAESTQKAFGTSAIEPNEVREEAGLEPLPDAENERARPTESEAGNPLDGDTTSEDASATSQPKGPDAEQQSRQQDAA